MQWAAPTSPSSRTGPREMPDRSPAVGRSAWSESTRRVIWSCAA